MQFTLGTILIYLLFFLPNFWEDPYTAEPIESEPTRSRAEPALIDLSQFPSSISPIPSLEIWEDKDHSLDPLTLLKEKSPYPEARIPSPTREPNFGLSESSFWFRFTTKNDSEKNLEYFLKIRYTLLDRIEFYHINPKTNTPVIRRSGRDIPASQQEIFYRGNAFSLLIPSSSETVFLFRIQSDSAISVPMKLWDSYSFHESIGNEQILQGLFFGAVFVMLFYNLFLFISLKDMGYFYYLLYLICFGIFFQMSLNGYIALYIFPDSDYLCKYLHNKIYILSVITIFPLFRYVLRTKVFFPTMDRIFYYFQFFMLGIFILEFFMGYSFINSLIDNISIVVILLALLSCVYIIRQGNSTAYYLFFAFLFVMLGGLAMLLRYKGILPWNFLTENSYQMGMGLELVLMGFALADRIQTMEKEKKSNDKKIQSFQKEMEIARKLQKSTLPVANPKITNLEFAAEYKPMSYVGGDFYDFHETDNELMVIIADVTGHGIPAAFEASMLKVAFFLETRVSKTPAQLLENINTTLIQTYHNQYLTASAIYIDLLQRKVSVANAGHPAFWIQNRNTKRFQKIRPRGTLIGVYDDLSLENRVIPIEKEDRLILFTDGIPDANNSKSREMFGEERMEEVFSASTHLSAQATAENLMSVANRWIGKSSPDDDMTIIIIDVLN